MNPNERGLPVLKRRVLRVKLLNKFVRKEPAGKKGGTKQPVLRSHNNNRWI